MPLISLGETGLAYGPAWDGPVRRPGRTAAGANGILWGVPDPDGLLWWW
ncbi:hypothetical protein F4558_000227 [Micromonospora profundi]|nr:hypothetical protein [Micromonospora profundi]NJC10401.1 hypothetical protein [Micromonospora profundi]